ncbi:type II toxin-antitoxin system VapC family toxin [Micromonospora sp. KC213]|uniref:type II toxin-antitoxin system VapC family toxin n=1 Tax=Micromonospora sp. KC213 TaxID=2530378 RepID=UPI001053044A|nr:type II toxin-antitoxin system VapC family toxin [Micromonospora sp. KC213]TDC33367.1 type II toxin-antitoxin system VapC family toxin [Micromonospora sp. KC213]
MISPTVTGEAPFRGLIDTNIVIHLAALDPAELPDEMVISAVTLAELSAGPHHTADPGERARRMSVLQHVEATFDPLPFDAEAARAFGLISAAVLAAGRGTHRRIADLMIVSVARSNGLPLYTTNPADFKGLDHLATIRPVRRPA